MAIIVNLGENLSIKLHRGLIVDPNLNLDVFEVTELVSNAITPVFKELAYTEACRILFSILDNPKVGLTNENGGILLRAAQQLWEDRNPTKNRNQFDHDPYRFSITFGKVNEKLLAYPYYLEDRYFPVLDSVEVNGEKLFLDYSYENQTDYIPEGLSKEAYYQRREDWLELSGEAGTLGHLPHWSVQDSLDIFAPLWANLDIDKVNSLGDSQTRLITRVRDFYLTNLFFKDIENPERIWSELPSLLTKVHRAVEKFLEDNPLPPELLPVALTTDLLLTDVSELPGYIVDEEFFAPLEKEFTNIAQKVH